MPLCLGQSHRSWFHCSLNIWNIQLQPSFKEPIWLWTLNQAISSKSESPWNIQRIKVSRVYRNPRNNLSTPYPQCTNSHGTLNIYIITKYQVLRKIELQHLPSVPRFLEHQALTKFSMSELPSNIESFQLPRSSLTLGTLHGYIASNVTKLQAHWIMASPQCARVPDISRWT